MMRVSQAPRHATYMNKGTEYVMLLRIRVTVCTPHDAKGREQPRRYGDIHVTASHGGTGASTSEHATWFKVLRVHRLMPSTRRLQKIYGAGCPSLQRLVESGTQPMFFRQMARRRMSGTVNATMGDDHCCVCKWRVYLTIWPARSKLCAYCLLVASAWQL